MANSEGPVQVEQHSGTAGPSSARRKLIRGAFALPAVATLHSGSALANSSSLKCLAKLPTGSAAPALTYFGDTGGIAFLRIPLSVATKPASNGRGSSGNGVGNGVGNGNALDYRYYVSGGELLAVANLRRVGISTLLPGNGFFQLFDVPGNRIAEPRTNLTSANIIADGYTLQDLTPLVPSPIVPNANRPFAALIFSADGNQIVGVGITGGENVNAATESCWTSFDTVA